MLEPHLAEIKQQEESKLGHPEPLELGKLLHAMYTEKTGGLLHHQTFSTPTGEHQTS
jgi:hypothetical protein